MSAPRLLVLDTASDSCAVGLSVDGQLFVRFEQTPRAHTQLILPMIQSLLDEAGMGLGQLDAIAFGRGPGSFTGVRIATSVVQGLAFGLDVAVIPLSSLAILAQGGYRLSGCPVIHACFDARMGEVYAASFGVDDNGDLRVQGQEWLGNPQLAPLPDVGNWVGVGSGWDQYHAILSGRCPASGWQHLPGLLPRAEDALVLALAAWRRGEAQGVESIAPIYLRDQVAVKPG